MSQQRQLAAIMFTDIVGFTFLMGRDENRGLAVVETNRTIHCDCLKAHNGHLVKEIGDGMLSWFSSAVDAVNCALAIQKAVGAHDYQLRIGIHLGDVVLKEHDVYGNTVNVASRVEALANPGAVFVTEQLVESTRGIDGIRFTFLGEKALKNVESSFRIFGMEHPELAKPELNVFLDESISQEIHQYHLVEKLGVGGMGIIYKALDTKLQRYVALKFLSSQLNQNEESREGFLKEARAAAALQHANICTIYEIDETKEGRVFIAMELVEGPTLQEYLKDEGPLSPAQCIDLAIQLAEGLLKAHQAGIVHRDIKPENIKITPEGTLKILDFGLALFGDPGRSNQGVRVGTVAYMSPEQARGELLDHRTDLWSFGVVVHEMLTGRLPFSGEYNHTLLHNILNEPPARLQEEVPNLPAGLYTLVDWCLEKDTTFRLQTTQDLVANLRRLKRDMGKGQEKEISQPSALKQFVSKGQPWLLPLSFLFLTALGWGVGRFFQSSPALGAPIAEPTATTMTPFTLLGGLSLHPSYSPGGDWIVYVSNEGGSMDLWKKQAAGGKAERLTSLPGNEVDPAWSPDGRGIAFRGDAQGGGIFIIPADGGTPFRLSNFGYSPAWSPDNRQLAFAANGNVYIVGANGGEPRLLVEGTSANPRPAWTADGMRILFWNRTLGDIHVIPASGGESRPLALTGAGEEITNLSLNKKGDRLLYSKGPFGGNKNLFEVAIDTTSSELTSMPRLLTLTPTDDVDATYSPDGQQIAFTAQILERHLYQFPLNPISGLVAGDSTKITIHGKMNYYPDLSPDGNKLIWTSHRSGNGNLYSGTLNDSNATKVTPEWKPNVREIGGRFHPLDEQVIFSSTQNGQYQLWKVPNVGGFGFTLTDPQHPQRDVHPSVSPDGSSVLFNSNRSGNWDIWYLELGNGQSPRQLTDWPGNELYAVWAPDGKTFAFVTNRDGNSDIWTMTLDGGKAQALIASPAEELWGAWSPDQRWFYFVSNKGGSYNIWRSSATGGQAEPVTRFNDPAFGLPENTIFTKFSVGRDKLVLPLESRKGDIFLLGIGEES